MAERVRGNQYRFFTVCVDRLDGGIMCGSYYNPYLSGGQAFTGLLDLILGIDGLLNEMGNPQQGCAIRSFTRFAEADNSSLSVLVPKEGQLATFSIKILFRQNASWQGSVQWVEGKSEESFRSVLELIYLMNSACVAS